jgi:hypothetical protein
MQAFRRNNFRVCSHSNDFFNPLTALLRLKLPPKNAKAVSVQMQLHVKSTVLPEMATKRHHVQII